MSEPVALAPRDRLPPHRRVLPLTAVAAARLLAFVRPSVIRWCLEHARRGAAPATTGQAPAARQHIVSVSLRCAGQGCLERSLAAALLCRFRGTWPTWCTRVRPHPFAAHAWIEAEGHPAGEPHPPGHRPLLSIAPCPTGPPAPGDETAHGSRRALPLRGGARRWSLPCRRARARVSRASRAPRHCRWQ
ncbi:lasso peptide biosynthesis B2 protein [Streptomyces sulphureus]|uniref:lasso peptide biosynthesis B2 protein n=1 Tax=Streptomyces sulphureus TaxID=47758 RepID=UPI0003A64368